MSVKITHGLDFTYVYPKRAVWLALRGLQYHPAKLNPSLSAGIGPLKSRLLKRSFGPKVNAFLSFFLGLQQDQNNPISLILRITITPVWVL